MQASRRYGLHLVGIITAAAFASCLGITAANAAVRSASGSHVCPLGQHIYVSVELEAPASEIVFYRGSTTFEKKVTDFGGFVEHYEGYRSGSWRVTTTGNIWTVSDGCALDPSIVQP